MIRSPYFSVIIFLFFCTPLHSFQVSDGERVNQQITDFDIVSDNLVGATTVRVMLPTGYSDTVSGYPVIYLLHGGGGTHEDWTVWGVQEIVDDRDVIIVQPSMGKGSWYADAAVPGIDGNPKWETFFFEELVTWVDGTFKTDARREGRAVVGLSMGGYGAMSYAARHPDQFIAAAAFSGAVDTSRELISNWIGVSPVIDARVPYSIFGIWPLDTEVRQAHNPLNLAHNLAGMHLSFYFGNGNRGVLDNQNEYNPVNLFMGWIQEAEVHRMNFAMHDRLNQLGIAHQFHPYGDGMHSPGYWIRSFRQELPELMRVFDNPPEPVNRLVNGDFEAEGIVGNADNNDWQCLGQCGLDRGLELEHQGVSNGWVRNSNTEWNELYQEISVAKKTDYHLSAWIRTSGSKLTLLGVRGMDGATLVDTPISASADYAVYQLAFNTGDHDVIRVFAGLQPGGDDAWLQLDDVFLAAGLAPPVAPVVPDEDPFEPFPNVPPEDDTNDGAPAKNSGGSAPVAGSGGGSIPLSALLLGLGFGVWRTISRSFSGRRTGRAAPR